jgi:N-acetylglutamate synthase-like GNAT family acetyltransferase
LLEQLFVSKDYRNKGIGKELFYLCSAQAKKWGADKLYLCAGSSEDTIAFYNKLGCVNTSEINQALYEEDPNDIQLEYQL